MRNKRSLLGLLLAVIMVIGLFAAMPLTAMADDAEQAVTTTAELLDAEEDGEDADVSVYVFKIGSTVVVANGEEIDYASKEYGLPYSSEDGNTMIPLRMISEALGFEVLWTQQDKSITISDADENVLGIIKLGDTKIYDIDGEEIGELIDAAGNPVAPTTGADERTYLPFRALLESLLGIERESIEWDNTEKTATVTI